MAWMRALNSRRVRNSAGRLPRSQGAVPSSWHGQTVSNTQDRPRGEHRASFVPEPRVIDPSVDRRPPSVPRGYSGEEDKQSDFSHAHAPTDTFVSCLLLVCVSTFARRNEKAKGRLQRPRHGHLT